YPNATAATGAVAIEILPGVDTNGIDISPRQVQTYRVRGRIVDAATGGLTRGQVTLSIVPRHPVTLTSSIASVAPYKPDGTFELSDVVPGEYWIRVQSSSPVTAGAAPPKPETALIAVDVGEADVDNVIVTPQPGSTVSGRVTVDGGSAAT